jgi:NADH-quinone oxidoreductase subunit N
MNLIDFVAISPLVILAVTAAILMALIAVYRHHGQSAILTFTGLASAFAALPAVAGLTPLTVTSLLVVDRYGIFFLGLILAAAMITVLLSYGYLRQQSGLREEFYLLILLAALGSATLVLSRHFASFFLGLEILSVSLYALVAYTRLRIVSIEAGIKYLVLAAVSSAFMLFGMALIYTDLGVLDFLGIAAQLQSLHGNGMTMSLMAGLCLVIVAIGFKLALAPFHMWISDIYQGAPAPAAAFVASVSKCAVAALLARLFATMDLNLYGALNAAFAGIAVASMLIGNILALMQENIKRLLAYSSIAHMGYLLVAFLSGGELALSAVAFYLVAYTITILGCFGVIACLSGTDRDADSMDDFYGLFFRSPWLAFIFTVMLLSLAGIPLTVGFVGKFYIVASGVNDALWLLVFFLVLTSGIGVYYYLRVLIAMYSRPAGNGLAYGSPHKAEMSNSLALAILVALILWLGIWPTPLIELINKMIG